MDKPGLKERAIQKVKNTWRLYILNPAPDKLAAELCALSENLLVVGTGRHEFYESRQSFAAAMSTGQREADQIAFEILDEWYAVQEITSDICVVYGTIWVREKGAQGQAVFVEMDSRFTIVCRDTPRGVEICSIHHSIPYLEQGDNEFYPKTLSSLAEQAILKTAALERRVQLDGLTEIYSRVFAQRHIEDAMSREKGVFFMLDLDGFKSVNDTLGHPAGDRMIQAFARLLQQVFGPPAVLGRMGGDEFAVWVGRISPEEAERRFAALVAGCRDYARKVNVPFCCSAGIARSGPEQESFISLYERADRALYRAKAKGKGRAEWAETPQDTPPA